MVKLPSSIIKLLPLAFIMRVSSAVTMLLNITTIIMMSVVMMMMIYNQGHAALPCNPNRNLLHCCHLSSSTLV